MDVSYIDDELIAEYQAQARDAGEAEGDDALAPPDEAPEVDAAVRTYYGNRLVYGARGVLYFSNGSANRPNDPCGRRNRWYVRMSPGSRIDPSRNCGSYYGYRITVY